MPAKSIDNLVYEYNKDFTRVHSNTDSTLIDEDELAEAVNFYWTQKGLRSRLGSSLFHDNSEYAFNGNIVHFNVYTRSNLDHFFLIAGTDTGYLYFIRASTDESVGQTAQTPVTDLTLGTDYPTDIYYFNRNDITETLSRFANYQWAIFRSPTATQVSGTPNYWDDEPALPATGIVDTLVFNNILYIISGEDDLYKFEGTLSSGNKLTDISSNIQAKASVTVGTTGFKKLGSKFSRLIVITDDDYVHGSAIGNGDSFSGVGSEQFTLRLGRIEGVDLLNFTSVKNSAIISLGNDQINKYLTNLLSSDGTTTSIRIDGIDENTGIKGSSGVAVNQNLIGLSDFGFVTIDAQGSNERFGLTAQRTISRFVNDFRERLDESQVRGVYYPGDKNWYMCQINNNEVLVLSVDYSEFNQTSILENTEVYKWSIFEYGFDIRGIESLLGYLFFIDDNNNILMSDVPGVYTDNGVQYQKRLRSKSFGSGPTDGNLSDQELKNHDKNIKQVKIHGIGRNLNNQSFNVFLSRTSGLTTLQTFEALASATFSFATIVDLFPAFDLFDNVDLGSVLQSPFFYKSNDLTTVARVAQILFRTNTELDLEITDFALGYMITKESKSDL